MTFCFLDTHTRFGGQHDVYTQQVYYEMAQAQASPCAGECLDHIVSNCAPLVPAWVGEHFTDRMKFCVNQLKSGKTLGDPGWHTHVQNNPSWRPPAWAWEAPQAGPSPCVSMGDPLLNFGMPGSQNTYATQQAAGHWAIAADSRTAQTALLAGDQFLSTYARNAGISLDSIENLGTALWVGFDGNVNARRFCDVLHPAFKVTIYKDQIISRCLRSTV